MTSGKLDGALNSLIDEAEAIAVVGLLSVREVDRMRIADARALRWLKGTERTPLVHYVAEGSWVSDQAGREPGETALVFLVPVSAAELEDRGTLRNRPHIRGAPTSLAGKRIWQLARDGHGWMPCRFIDGKLHAMVWRTELSFLRALPRVPAPKPWRDLADGVPLNDLVDAIQARLEAPRGSEK